MLLKQGYLVKSWRERWCVLFPDRLAYYDPSEWESAKEGSKASARPKGVLLLADVVGVTPLRSRGAFQVSVVGGASTGSSRSGDRDFYLVAASDAERSGWISALHASLFTPARPAVILRLAQEWREAGRLCGAEAARVCLWLGSGADADIERAAGLLARVSSAKPGERGTDALEGALLDFECAGSEGALLSALSSLRSAVTGLPAEHVASIEEVSALGDAPAGLDTPPPPPPLARDRLVAAAMEHYDHRSAASSSAAAGAASASASSAGDADGGEPSHSSSSVGGAFPPPAGSSIWTPAVQESFALLLHAIAVADSRIGGGAGDAPAPCSPSAGNEHARAAVTTGEVDDTSAGSDEGSSGGAAATPAKPRGGAGGSVAVAPSAGSSDGASSAVAQAEVVPATPTPAHSSRGSRSPVPPAMPPDDFLPPELPPTPAPGAGPSSPGSPSTSSSSTDPLAEFREDARFTEAYILGEKLGEGAYSSVYRAVHRASGAAVAVKIAPKARMNPGETRRLVDEVAVMARLRHPHVVRLWAFHEDVGSYFIVTELMTGGELFDRIVSRSHYSEREARDVVRTIAQALRYMHARGIVHRDLKPENVLLTSRETEGSAAAAAAAAAAAGGGAASGAGADMGVIKIADMGFAKQLPGWVPPTPGALPMAASVAGSGSQSSASSSSASGSQAWGLTTSCGTPSYVAPEILRGERYGEKVDLWSLGVIAYILLCGYAPFASTSGNQGDLFRAIVSGRYFFDSPYWDGVSPGAKDLIRGLLTVDPASRLSAEGVLTHPWLHGSVSSRELSLALSQMRLFQASRKAVLRAGLLTKQGHFVRNWKRRLFVLTSDSLEYYDPAALLAAAAAADAGAGGPAPPPASAFSSLLASTAAAAAAAAGGGGGGAASVAPGAGEGESGSGLGGAALGMGGDDSAVVAVTDSPLQPTQAGGSARARRSASISSTGSAKGGAGAKAVAAAAAAVVATGGQASLAPPFTSSSSAAASAAASAAPSSEALVEALLAALTHSLGSGAPVKPKGAIALKDIREVAVMPATATTTAAAAAVAGASASAALPAGASQQQQHSAPQTGSIDSSSGEGGSTPAAAQHSLLGGAGSAFALVGPGGAPPPPSSPDLRLSSPPPPPPPLLRSLSSANAGASSSSGGLPSAEAPASTSGSGGSGGGGTKSFASSLLASAASLATSAGAAISTAGVVLSERLGGGGPLSSSAAPHPAPPVPLPASYAPGAGPEGPGVVGDGNGEGDGSDGEGSGGAVDSEGVPSPLTRRSPSQPTSPTARPGSPTAVLLPALGGLSLGPGQPLEAAAATGSEAHATPASQQSSPSSPSAPSGSWCYPLRVTLVGGKEYRLLAETPAARAEWVRALSTAQTHGDLVRRAAVAFSSGEGHLGEAVALMKMAALWQEHVMCVGSAGASGGGRAPSRSQMSSAHLVGGAGSHDPALQPQPGGVGGRRDAYPQPGSAFGRSPLVPMRLRTREQSAAVMFAGASRLGPPSGGAEGGAGGPVGTGGPGGPGNFITSKVTRFQEALARTDAAEAAAAARAAAGLPPLGAGASGRALKAAAASSGAASGGVPVSAKKDKIAAAIAAGAAAGGAPAGGGSSTVADAPAAQLPTVPEEAPLQAGPSGQPDSELPQLLREGEAV